MSGTILASIIIMSLAIMCLSIGWFLTGRNRCGSSCGGLAAKTKPPENSCSGNKLDCSLCGRKNQTDTPENKDLTSSGDLSPNPKI